MNSMRKLFEGIHFPIKSPQADKLMALMTPETDNPLRPDQVDTIAQATLSYAMNLAHSKPEDVSEGLLAFLKVTNRARENNPDNAFAEAMTKRTLDTFERLNPSIYLPTGTAPELLKLCQTLQERAIQQASVTPDANDHHLIRLREVQNQLAAGVQILGRSVKDSDWSREKITPENFENLGRITAFLDQLTSSTSHVTKLVGLSSRNEEWGQATIQGQGKEIWAHNHMYNPPNVLAVTRVMHMEPHQIANGEIIDNAIKNPIFSLLLTTRAPDTNAAVPAAAYAMSKITAQHPWVDLMNDARNQGNPHFNYTTAVLRWRQQQEVATAEKAVAAKTAIQLRIDAAVTAALAVNKPAPAPTQKPPAEPARRGLFSWFTKQDTKLST